jgi:cytochrome c-type biogenesis protein CcmH/NrfF
MILKEILDFLRARRKLWLLPVVIVLLLIGLIIIVSSSTAIAPFIYTIF